MEARIPFLDLKYYLRFLEIRIHFALEIYWGHLSLHVYMQY